MMKMLEDIPDDTKDKNIFPTTVFGWGNTSNGELGLGGIEDDHILMPTLLKNFSKESCINDISCGKNHTLALLQNGIVYSCGSNDVGQLGHSSARMRLEQITSLSAHTIRVVVCGSGHSLALNEAGQVFSWGSNTSGQLGLSIEDDSVPFPRMIKSLAVLQIVQVTCGSYHSLALTNNGELYSWGQNNFGQLGLGKKTSLESSPQLLTSLSGVPISQIAAGGYHSFVLTLSGGLFGWGKNTFGQLGVNDNDNRFQPVALESLRTQQIRYVCCGEDHTCALTQDGGVFTFGAGMYGQLGHGSKSNEILPRRVIELMGSIVTQITCGRCHTLTYVPKKRRIYSFGLGGSGQLGLGTSTSVFTPMVVAGPWSIDFTNGSPNTDGNNIPTFQIYDGKGNGLMEAKIDEDTNFSQEISSNCTGSVIQAEEMETEASSLSEMEVDGGTECEENNQHFLSMEFLGSFQNSSQLNTGTDAKCLTKLNGHNPIMYKLISGGDHSFVIATPADQNISSQDLRKIASESQIMVLDNNIIKEVRNILETDCVPQDIMSYIETVFSSSACLNGSYLNHDGSHYNCSSINHGIDMTAAYYGFQCIEEAKNSTISELVGSCLKTILFSSLAVVPPCEEALRLYLFVPLCHLFHEPAVYLRTLICPFAISLLRLSDKEAKIIGCWWSQIEVAHFKNLVLVFKKAVIYILNVSPKGPIEENAYRSELKVSLNMLEKLNKVNIENREIIPYQEFYITEITEKVDVKLQYIQWINRLDRTMSFCDYPFVFDAQAKTLILQMDSILQMQNAMDAAYQQRVASVFIPTIVPDNPYLVLPVSRENIVEDTITQLSRHTSADLMKPLKVIFCGEEAVDAGGVSKEFFLLLLKEILDPKYGMFKEYPESRCIWFNSKTFEDPVMFHLIGVLCGLAIYNFTIINLPFPLVLYKKLLKEETNLDDLKSLSPSVAKCLQDLLDYDGDDVEEVFLLNFEICVEVFGENETHELKPGGHSTAVTSSNKKEYVQLYIDFILNKSVAQPFDSFSRGFHKVCRSRILQLFHAQELMALVIGNEIYNWQELEDNTEYKPEFNAYHPVIRMFWKVFHSLSESDKKKFLLFLTGSDRIPILGMKTIKLIIQPMKVGDEFLPVAHTCFNILDLPYYRSEEILRNKLLQAIQHTHGFGLA